MKEIIGDDYPTYEDSVNATLAEKQQEDAYTYLKEVEDKIHKDNLERLMKENLELRHRLDCIASDIELVARHICKYDSAEIFKLPSLESNGKIFADEAWHNITNIEIACDLNDDASLSWGAKCTHELDNLNKDLGEDPVFQGHLKHMESVDEYSSKYKGKK
jgi:hypothetical protein